MMIISRRIVNHLANMHRRMQKSEVIQAGHQLPGFKTYYGAMLQQVRLEPMKKERSVHV